MSISIVFLDGPCTVELTTSSVSLSPPRCGTVNSLLDHQSVICDLTIQALV